MNYPYIYVVKLTENIILFSGIGFEEFYVNLEMPINNILLLKGDFIGSKSVSNFELFEGENDINRLIFHFGKGEASTGDFHFIDYQNKDGPLSLTEANIKDLLYMSHMWSPKDSAAFDLLQSRFMYMSHDNDWYCKLYVRNYDFTFFGNVIVTKLLKHIENSICGDGRKKVFLGFSKKMRNTTFTPQISRDTVQNICSLFKDGLFIDLQNTEILSDKITINMYTIGEFGDMDNMYNNIEEHKRNAKIVKLNFYSNGHTAMETTRRRSTSVRTDWG